LNKPRVINLLTDVIPADTVYIGRGSPWGNIFKVGEHGTESEVAQKYINWLQKQPELIAAAKQELRGRHLACFCKPGLCHGDLLLILSNDESFDINDADSIFNLIKQGNNNGI
jgi:hypothetical protein